MSELNQDTATRAEELIHRVEAYTRAINTTMAELKLLLSPKPKQGDPQPNIRITEVASTRLANTCLRHGIYTLGQLAEMRKIDLLHFKAFGMKSLQEAQRILEENGLSFKE